MVTGGVNEDSVLVPACTLDSHVLIHSALGHQFTIAHRQGCGGGECEGVGVGVGNVKVCVHVWGVYRENI